MMGLLIYESVLLFKIRVSMKLTKASDIALLRFVKD